MQVFWDLWIQWSNCPLFVAKKDLHWNCLAEKGKSGYFCQDAKFCSTPNDGSGAWWLPPLWWQVEWEKGPRQRPGWDLAEPEFFQIISNNFGMRHWWTLKVHLSFLVFPLSLKGLSQPQQWQSPLDPWGWEELPSCSGRGGCKLRWVQISLQTWGCLDLKLYLMFYQPTVQCIS